MPKTSTAALLGGHNMRDYNVQVAGVPDGAIYKEVVVIGTFLFKKC